MTMAAETTTRSDLHDSLPVGNERKTKTRRTSRTHTAILPTVYGSSAPEDESETTTERRAVATRSLPNLLSGSRTHANRPIEVSVETVTAFSAAMAPLLGAPSLASGMAAA